MVVLKPSGKPASARSALAADTPKAYHSSPTQPFGIEQGVKWVATCEPGGMKLSTIRCRSIPMAIAWRTFGLSNGGYVLFMPT